MGANFVTKRFPGELNEKALQEAFAKAQDDDRYENGHSYSGGFGMATGLSLEKRKFDDFDAAYTHVEENASKWGDAIAVKVTVDGIATWFVGAWCAS